MNAKKLKQLAEKNDTAKRILSMVASRKRNTRFTAFSGLRADLKKRDRKEAVRKDFDSTFAELEKMGVGKVQKTEAGTFVGFHWDMPIRDLAAALNEKGEAKPKTILRPKVPASVVAAEKEEKVQPNVPYASSDQSEKYPATIVILRKGKCAETFETDDVIAGQIISSLSH